VRDRGSSLRTGVRSGAERGEDDPCSRRTATHSGDHRRLGRRARSCERLLGLASDDESRELQEHLASW